MKTIVEEKNINIVAPKTAELAIQETQNPVVVSESGQVLEMISTIVQHENFNVDALEKLVNLQIGMEDRQAKKAFNADFSAMMSEIPVIAKTGWNDFQKSQFAKLEDIVETVRPILFKHGFSITYKQSQEMLPNVKFEPNVVFCMMNVICVLKHKLGHQEETELLLPISPIKGQTMVQAIGAGSTYGRRYTLMQALNIAVAGADNDGNVAEFAKVATSEKKKITDNQFKKALVLVKEGKMDLFKDLLARYELSQEQESQISVLLKGE